MKKSILSSILFSIFTQAFAGVNLPVENRVNLVIGSSTSTASWSNITMSSPGDSYAASVESYVNAQRKFSGRKILSTGSGKGIDAYKDFYKIINFASQSKDFEYAYIADEIYWTGSNNNIGYLENETISAAKYAKNKGFKTIATIMPYTVMDKNFRFKDLNSLDVIVLDPYPSISPKSNVSGCSYNPNPISMELSCSIKKLRSLGYRGEVWYAYQAFLINGEDKVKLEQSMRFQSQTISQSKSLGITGLIPFGLTLPKDFPEKALLQGAGSQIDSFVSPSNGSTVNKPSVYAKTYNIQTINSKSQFGVIKVDINGNVSGTYTNKYCRYYNNNYTYDGSGSCLYLDNKWYPASTPGVSLVTNTVTFNGLVDAGGYYKGKWNQVSWIDGVKQTIDTSMNGSISAYILNGVMTGSIYGLNGDKLADFRAQ